MALKLMYESSPINVPLTALDDTTTSGTKAWSSSRVVEEISNMSNSIGIDFGFNYKFTYLVKDDNSLAYWLTKGTEGYGTSNDFTNVLIRSGTYTFNGTSLALDVIGTKAIVGEQGATLALNGASSFLKYNTVHRDPAYYMYGFKVTSDTTKSVIENAFNLSRVVVNDGQIFGYSENKLYWSATGEYWLNQDIGTQPPVIYDAIFEGNKFVLGTSKGVLVSTDGTSFAAVSQTSTLSVTSNAYLNNKYILTCNNNAVKITTDIDDYSSYTNIGVGETGSEQTAIIGTLFTVNGKLFSCGTNSLFIAADDLSVWQNTNITAHPTCMDYFNDMYICATEEASTGRGLFYSTDGITWSTTSSVDKDFIYVKATTNKAVALASDYSIYYTTDGMNWLPTNISTGQVASTFASATRLQRCVVNNNITIMAAGENVYKSLDGGAVWELISGVTLEKESGVFYVLGKWIIGAYSSEDTETWSINSTTEPLYVSSCFYKSPVALSIKQCFSVRDCWLNALSISKGNYSSPVTITPNTVGSDSYGGFNIFSDGRTYGYQPFFSFTDEEDLSITTNEGNV